MPSLMEKLDECFRDNLIGLVRRFVDVYREATESLPSGCRERALAAIPKGGVQARRLVFASGRPERGIYIVEIDTVYVSLTWEWRPRRPSDVIGTISHEFRHRQQFTMILLLKEAQRAINDVLRTYGEWLPGELGLSLYHFREVVECDANEVKSRVLTQLSIVDFEGSCDEALREAVKIVASAMCKEFMCEDLSVEGAARYFLRVYKRECGERK